MRPHFEPLEDRNLMAFNVLPTGDLEGAGQVTVIVERSGERNETATVDFRTLDGAAKAGSDYDVNAGRLTFNPGISRQTLSVSLLGSDVVAETLESFSVQLFNPQGDTITLGRGEAAVSIKDDDAIIVTGPDAGFEPREREGARNLVNKVPDTFVPLQPASLKMDGQEPRDATGRVPESSARATGQEQTPATSTK